MEGCNPTHTNGSNYTNYCRYIKETQACALPSGFINYFLWQYCGFNERISPTILMFIWLLMLLIAIGTVADSFLAPCLLSVAKTLRMSQNLAGVTLLAFGNGAPDIFSSLSAVLSSNSPQVGLSFGSILGAGVMVNTVTSGIIMIIVSFDLMKRPIMKDLLFYLVALLWCVVIFVRRKIELWSSLIFLVIYTVYILVTVISTLVYSKKGKKEKKDNVEITVDEVPDERITNSVESNKNVNLTSIPEIYNNEDNTLTVTSSTILHKVDKIDLKQDLKTGYVNPTFIDNRLEREKVTNKNNQLNIDDNPNKEASFVNTDHHKGFLGLPVYNQSFKYRRSSDTSSIDDKTPKSSFEKRKYSAIKVGVMRSTSHRSIGSFAKIIIENEKEKENALMRENLKMQQTKNISRSNSLNINNQTERGQIRFYSMSYDRDEANDIKKQAEIVLNEIKSRGSADNSQNEATVPTYDETMEPIEFPGILKHCLLTIMPIDVDVWKEQSHFENVLSVLQSPFMLIFTLTIPVVDENAFLKGWCKILNCFHCLVSPLMWVILVNVFDVNFGSSTFNVAYFMIIFGAICCTVVATTSLADKRPVYHRAFAFFGLVTSVTWIYEISNEIVNILNVYGVVLDISQTILGLSVLAFANSLGDLVADITLAKRNYPRIGYSACIGGPLFYLLFGIGLPFSIKTINGPIDIDLKSESIVLIFTILLVTVMNIIALPLMKFRTRRSYGICLIVIYVLFFILVILFAADVIQVNV